MNILIVDDIAENIYLLEAMLESDGYGVVSARNGKEALKRLQEGTFAMIISDILMPVMDGFQFCRECKTNLEWARIPFIFYTATYTEKKDEEFAMTLGADRFIVKPQTPEVFLKIIKETLDLIQHSAETVVKSSSLEETAYLSTYNERVVRKLEKKVSDLAKINLMLRESEDKYRLVVDNATDAILIVQDGMIHFTNPGGEKLLAYSEGMLTSRSFPEFIHPDDRELVLERHRKRFKKEEVPTVYPFRVVAADGTIKWVEINAVVINWKGRPATLSFLKDITKRKQAEIEKAKLEAQLQQVQKMESVGRLAGGVAHDFNNMLGVILGYAEIALDKVDPAQPPHADLQEIRNAANRSANLTRQLLAFASKQVVSPKVVDINETVEGMLKMLRRLIGEDIYLTWLPGANVWPVKVDPSQLDQLLANLCINARDAIAGVGKLTIETENVSFDEEYCADHPGFPPGKFVLLIVSDDGCGMDKDTVDKIFEPFFTTKGVGKGTGLGLATVYGIIKQNNGFINVYSEPDKGTTFKIYLPRHAGTTEEKRTEVAVDPIRRGQETILLVEDEPTLLELSKLLLETQGYRVLPADTPGDAVRLAEEHAGNIHLLMTDVVMPEMNGRDLAKKLLFQNPHLKCLFTSGYTANVIAHHGVLDEGVYFIQKPFSRRDLAAKVREVLDHK